MATRMFASSKPVPFNPYGRRRSGWRVPRWAVLLLAGTAIGAGAVVYVQERHLPLRLSASESSQLNSAFAQADAERTQLKSSLADTERRLAAALADKKAAVDELADSRARAERLHDDLAVAVNALPADPRSGSVEVRAGRFTAQGGAMQYEVVLTRERGSAKAMPGVMQLVVAGQSARGVETSVALKPVVLSLGSMAVVRGSLPLPEGFKPRQTTVQVLDKSAGKSLGMRVLAVR